MNTHDDTQSQEGDAQTVQDGGEQQQQAPESALDAFSRGVEAARAQEGGAAPAEGATGATGATESAGATGATAAADPKGATGADLTPEQKAEAERKSALDAEIKELGLKEKKAERFRTLEAGYREAIALKKEIEPLRQKAQELDQFHAVLRDTNARPEQIGTMFRLIKLSNSGDVGNMRTALKEIQAYAVELAKACGEPVQPFSPLNDHPDLLQKVTEGVLTEEAAIELIRARATEARTNETRQQQEAERAQLAAAEKEKNDGIESLNALGRDLGASDPHYAHKLNVMKEAGTLKAIQRLRPSQWAEAFRDAYSELKAPPPKPRVGEMPLRPNGAAAAGGGMARTVPSKAEDAFAFGVAQAREQGL